MARDDIPSADASDSDAHTRILRRAPRTTDGEPPTGIIRRHPTGEVPVPTDDAPTSLVGSVAGGPPAPAPVRPGAAIATAVVSIVSGWATAVIATDLITGWWRTDPLFCVAIGFLAAISAAASISGVIALLLRRRTARLLVIVGAVIALLIFASLFIAGATLPTAVYALPLLPAATVALAALPQTGRWERS
ncbi:hypothetical protein [Mycobacterium sp. SMC-4]|uniref:hypothetical protein n=1 Tax=Mycobacterium sp. SMC-4 TaxID=2857059 RepID=UPI0021B41F6F|nr:hypothetical protein [Mycobacterium sp. SMC-4]UXA17208.1 hypothetical protein KXD98_21055 [Mycobacterium sp. SMC-4]